MSKKPVRIDEENNRLRQELKKIKDEIRKSSQNSSFFSSQDKSKLVTKIKENLEQGIFSPPKKPISNQKSPLHKSKKKNKQKSPDFKSTSRKSFDNKENQEIMIDQNKQSPNFLLNQEGLVFTDTFSNTYLDPCSEVLESKRVNEQTLQVLERENNLLKELNSLRLENQKLRTQLKVKKGKDKSRKSSTSKVSIVNHKKKLSFTGFELLANSKILSISPKPSRKSSYKQSGSSSFNLNGDTVSPSMKTLKTKKKEGKRLNSKSPDCSSVRKNSHESFSDIQMIA